ncbi:MAG: aspartate aminotransferase family protein [archaeon]|nr:aspartate aminotransferase family protein [archaeon]
MVIKGYTIEPKTVPLINTENRTICTQIPVPESIPLLKRLREVESYSLHWQFPIFWDHGEGFNVYDKYGNKFIDFSCGIAVTSIGHGHKEVIDAIVKQTQHGLLYNFTFPSEIRMKLLEKIIEYTPSHLNKAFLMCSGSEACECMIKIMRKYTQTKYNPEKNIIITFENAFHGRTLGSQIAGGLPALKDWIKNSDPDNIQVPFPDGYYNEDTSFDLFEKTLKEKGINLDNICGVMVEGFQGSHVHFMPNEYAKKLEKWCKDHNALLAFDEVQSGFGRSGKKFGFMHYNVEPDVISLGKGISGCLPISATVARKEIMDVFPPGTMTSTHTGNPVSCAAALANIEVMEREKLVEKSAELGKILQDRIQKLVEKYDIIGDGTGRGLISGMQVVEPGTKNPNKQLAYEINQRIIEKGVMLFAPVGKATVKFAIPFVISETALIEGLDAVDEAIGEIIAEKNLS